jgi:SAM-dependent methyltransferase
VTRPRRANIDRFMMRTTSDRLECRVCGSRPGRRFHVGRFEYARCRGCGTINKILTQAEYDALSVTYDPGDVIEHLETDELRKLLAVEVKKELLQPIINRLRSQARGDRKLRLLDIGCGMGGYLVAARELGFEARGIEPSASHSGVGCGRFGLDIANAYFSPTTAGPQPYDIIILSHVIEHIYDQRAFLSDVYSILAPGGVIFLATPNACSTIARITGRYWSMLRPVDHVGLLSSRALRALAPPEAQTTVRTDEYAWEPFIAIATGIRNMLERHSLARLPSVGSRGPAKSQSDAPRSPSNSFRSSAAAVEQRGRLRFVATMLSLPLYLFDRKFGFAACLVCEIQRPL